MIASAITPAPTIPTRIDRAPSAFPPSTLPDRHLGPEQRASRVDSRRRPCATSSVTARRAAGRRSPRRGPAAPGPGRAPRGPARARRRCRAPRRSPRRSSGARWRDPRPPIAGRRCDAPAAAAWRVIPARSKCHSARCAHTSAGHQSPSAIARSMAPAAAAAARRWSTRARPRGTPRPAPRGGGRREAPAAVGRRGGGGAPSADRARATSPAIVPAAARPSSGGRARGVAVARSAQAGPFAARPRRSSSTRSMRSQGRSRSSRPKWPYAAVGR